MSRRMGDLGDCLADWVRKCRRAECKEELHAQLYQRPWNQALLDRFNERCKEDPDLTWAASMIYARARSDLANELLPGIERHLGSYVYDEFSIELPPEPLRPEIVVDNSAGTSETAPDRRKRKAKGKRAVQRPAGDAA